MTVFFVYEVESDLFQISGDYFVHFNVSLKFRIKDAYVSIIGI